jgi:ubiquinone/menaquinone biosynthesis C-methylase UbiE
MSDSDKVFAGSIPERYERFLVPLIFEPYALDMARRVAATRPNDVLEIAAGTGVATRALSAQLPADTRIVATDLNEPRLQTAKAKHPSTRALQWRQADALSRPFGDAAFDAVICQFGAMFFPDKQKAFKEARRALKPGGRFFFSVWDRISDNEFADVVTQALGLVFPSDPPRFLARTPHGYHDVKGITAELGAAGFSDIAAEPVTHLSRAATPRDPAIAYCQGTPLRNEIEARDPAGLENATDAATKALQKQFGDGPIEGRIQAIVFSAGRIASCSSWRQP